MMLFANSTCGASMAMKIYICTKMLKNYTWYTIRLLEKMPCNLLEKWQQLCVCAIQSFVIGHILEDLSSMGREKANSETKNF